jgi:hypothetical protein
MAEKRQEIVTQLRSLGDNKNIVLYTNDARVYRKLQDSDKLLKLVRYEQEQGGKIATVGVDLYFPKEHRKWLEKNIGVYTSGEI